MIYCYKIKFLLFKINRRSKYSSLNLEFDVRLVYLDRGSICYTINKQHRDLSSFSSRTQVFLSDVLGTADTIMGSLENLVAIFPWNNSNYRTIRILLRVCRARVS